MRLKERERLLNVRPRCLIRVANTSDSSSVTATGKRYRAVDVMPTHAHTQGRSRRTGVQTLATGTAATGSEQHAGVTCASRRLCGCATSDMTSSNSSRRRGRKASSKKVAFERETRLGIKARFRETASIIKTAPSRFSLQRSTERHTASANCGLRLPQETACSRARFLAELKACITAQCARRWAPIRRRKAPPHHRAPFACACERVRVRWLTTALRRTSQMAAPPPLPAQSPSGKL